MRKRKGVTGLERVRKRRPGQRWTPAKRLAAQNPFLGDLYLEGYKAGIREGVDIGIEELQKALLQKRRG